MNPQIALISCTKIKFLNPDKASELYKKSPWFKFAMKYAKSLSPQKIYILSPKYLLLNPNQIIEPYEQTLDTMSTKKVRLWAEKVLLQLKAETDLQNANFIILAGEKYRKYLLPNIKHYQIPLEGLTNGKQLQKLKQLTHNLPE